MARGCRSCDWWSNDDWACARLRLVVEVMIDHDDPAPYHGVAEMAEVGPLGPLSASEVREVSASGLTPWNWCPTCEQSVDADDVFDGSEVRCFGCDRFYTCVQYVGGSWWMLPVESADEDDEDPLCESCDKPVPDDAERLFDADDGIYLHRACFASFEAAQDAITPGGTDDYVFAAADFSPSRSVTFDFDDEPSAGDEADAVERAR